VGRALSRARAFAGWRFRPAQKSEEHCLRIIAALVLIVWLSLPGFAVQPKPHPAAAASKKPVSKGSKKGRRSAAARRAAVKRKPAGQMAPTPERYQEIQQALTAKGYGPHAPDGVWNPAWADALKHYQQDQKLEATGKLTSMSLITLGLGPKRDQPAGATAPSAPPENPPASSSSTVRELK
jgi:peptidoglycan hydrolase-like protein with peptidoglycan-binding domain